MFEKKEFSIFLSSIFELGAFTYTWKTFGGTLMGSGSEVGYLSDGPGFLPDCTSDLVLVVFYSFTGLPTNWRWKSPLPLLETPTVTAL